MYIAIHSVQSDIRIENIDKQDKEELVKDILKWIEKELSDQTTKDVIDRIAETLPDLDKLEKNE